MLTQNNWDSDFSIYDNLRVHNNKVLFGYKGLNEDMSCLEFKYDIGKKYEIKELSLCDSWFHFCRYPIDVLEYYKKPEHIYAMIQTDGIVYEDINKCVTNSITIIGIITKDELIDMMPEHIIRIDNSNEWYKNGKLLRECNFPAVIGGSITADDIFEETLKYDKLIIGNGIKCVI